MSRSNLLRAGGYGRVGTTVQIKAVLLSNRYVEIFGPDGRAQPRRPPRRAVSDENPSVAREIKSLLESYP
jgi:hypothetical protein